MKIGRNQTCPCGSGKKYKKCCDQLDKPMRPIPPEVMQMMRADEAAERVRTQQQGHGRGIISFESHGYRLVAVADRIFWSKNWLVFPDFLMHHMKDVLNPQWGQRESQNPVNTHPLFRWLRKFQEYKSTQGKGTGRIRSGKMMGFIACPLHLAYALYLIAHHDQIPKRLLQRLRDPQTFLPAYYETLAGAAFAVAGFEIRCEETKKSANPTPEFTVTSKSTRKSYSVEAKRKDGWT